LILKKTPEDLLSILEDMQQYDTNQALSSINKKIGLRQKRTWVVRFQRVAAIILLLLFIGSAAYNFVLKKNMPLQSSAWHTIETLPGQKAILDLPDGTRVWLNSETSIVYPSVFSKKSREVKLIGEAYFDVAKMPGKPFLVDMGDLEIDVLGTKFNIANYVNENEASIFLESGSIQLHSISGDTERTLYRMEPGERAQYNKEKRELVIGTGYSDICLAWMDGKIIFRDVPMEKVVQSLDRWFNADIRIVDPELKDYTYTATFQHESLEQVLDLLSRSAPIEYKIINREKDDNNVFTKTRVELYTPSFEL